MAGSPALLKEVPPVGAVVFKADTFVVFPKSLVQKTVDWVATTAKSLVSEAATQSSPFMRPISPGADRICGVPAVGPTAREVGSGVGVGPDNEPTASGPKFRPAKTKALIVAARAVWASRLSNRTSVEFIAIAVVMPRVSGAAPPEGSSISGVGTAACR